MSDDHKPPEPSRDAGSSNGSGRHGAATRRRVRPSAAAWRTGAAPSWSRSATSRARPSGSSSKTARAVPDDRLDRAGGGVRAAAELGAARAAPAPRCRSARSRSWPGTTRSLPRCCSTTMTASRSKPRPPRRCCWPTARFRPNRRDRRRKRATKARAARKPRKQPPRAKKKRPRKANRRSKKPTRAAQKEAAVEALPVAQQALWASYPPPGPRPSS